MAQFHELRHSLNEADSLATAGGSPALDWHRLCCQPAASSIPQCTLVLCCRDLRRASASCLSRGGIALDRPPAEVRDVSRPWAESGKSLSQPAANIPDTEVPASSCGRNPFQSFRR